jgi:chemotaxis response regulator CheB
MSPASTISVVINRSPQRNLLAKIRVLLVAIPPMLVDGLRQIVAEQPDVEVVGDFADYGVELLVAVGQTRADVVILGVSTSELPGVCSHLLGEYPRVKVLALTADGRTAFVHGYRTQTVQIEEASWRGLIDMVRSAVRESSGNVSPGARNDSVPCG